MKDCLHKPQSRILLSVAEVVPYVLVWSALQREITGESKAQDRERGSQPSCMSASTRRPKI